MSKRKRNKSAAGSANTQRWDVAITNTPFSEEGVWTACTTLVVGSKQEDSVHVSALTDAVNTKQRRLFRVITQQSLFDEVNELGNLKGKKPKELPLNMEVCEVCKVYLDAGEELPLPLLSKLIKYKLLDWKLKDVNRRETEKKASEKTPKKGEGKKEGAKSAKGKQERKAPETTKTSSKLRKRGEEEQAHTFVDDEPEDGANHYFVISGFHSPYLISHLAEIGVFIDCVLRMTSEEYPVPDLTSEVPSGEEPQPKDEKQIALEEEQAKAEQKERMQLVLFWRDTFPLLKASTVLKLHDIPCLDYTVKQSIVPTNLEDFEQRSEYHELLYDDISALMYHLLESKRQWRNYIKNTKLQHVPMPNEQHGASMRDIHSLPSASPVPGTVATKAVTVLGVSEGPDTARGLGADMTVDEADMRLYTELMNCVPAESTSVFLIMHCMLEQIEATEEGRELDMPKMQRPDGLEDDLANYITQMAMKLGLSETEEKRLIASDFDLLPKSPPPSGAPQLVRHRDEMALRLRHLQANENFDMLAAEMAMVRMLGYNWPNGGENGDEEEDAGAERERWARTHEMMSFLCGNGIDESQVDHAFRQFIFESMKLTGVDGESGAIQRLHRPITASHMPWDDPYPYYKEMIRSESPKDDWEMDERMESLITSIRSGACTPNNPLHGQQRGLADRIPSSGGLRQALFERPFGRGNSSHANSASTVAQPTSTRQSQRASQRCSSVQSVHFEIDDQGNTIPQPGDDGGGGWEGGSRIVTPGMEEEEREEVQLVVGSGLKEVNDPQARILDEWCFAENLPAHVLQQVLMEASYVLPYMDSYRNIRDHSLMLVLHNPYDKGIKNQTSWQTMLHSDVNFRNYLDYVAHLITDWTVEEEAKYNAQMLSREVEKMTESTAPPEPVDAKKSRQSTAKSRKKDRSKSPSPKNDKALSRTGSLKALKEEKDRQKSDEEADPDSKDKRRKSGKRLGSAKDKNRKSLTPSGSQGKLTDDLSPTPALTLINEPMPPYWPFSGYDLGDNIVQASGSTTVLFPVDGGQIRVEKVDFVEGQRSVRVVVLKDGHIFTVNVLDPKDLSIQDDSPVETEPAAAVENAEEAEKADSEKSEKEEQAAASVLPTAPVAVLTPAARVENVEVKSTAESAVTFSDSVHDLTTGGQQQQQLQDMTAGVPEEDSARGLLGSVGNPPPGMPAAISAFSSFTARFKDGMCLAFSAYGDTGEPIDGRPHVPPPYKMPPQRTVTPSVKDGAKVESPAKARTKTKERVPTPEPVEEETAEKDMIPYQPFQQMFVTCPDGLNVSYFLETAYGIRPDTDDDRRLLVRQTYTVRTSGTQLCEAARANAMLEVSRVTNCDGTVIKTMHDGTTQVLYADGTMAHLLLHSPLLPESRASTPPVARVESPRSGRDSKRSKKRTKRGDVPADMGDESQQMSKWHWLITTPSGERFAMRKDGRHLASAKPAMMCRSTDPQTKQIMSSREDNVVTIRYPDGSTVVEHADGTRITTYYKQIKVYADDSLPESDNAAETELTSVKCVQVECPGFATVHFNDGHCDTIFACDTYVRTFLEGRHIVNHSTGSRLTMSREGIALYEASEVVQNEGTTGYFFNHASATVCSMVDVEGNSFTVQNDGECHAVRSSEEIDEKVGYGHHAPRLFIVKTDGSGTELLRYADIAEFMTSAEDDITTAMIADPLANQEGVVGMTTLSPIVSDVSRDWLRPYASDSLTPPGLAHRDLRGLPPDILVVPGPPFGTKAGRGLAIGSCANRKAPRVAPPCPDVLQLRQILQHRPLSEELRHQLSDQLRRYADFVMSRQIEADSFLLCEPRSEGECILATEMAAPYSTADIADEVEIGQQSSAAPTSLLEGDVCALYLQATAPPEPSPPPTPMPKRTNSDWERDARELADALDARLALRHNHVPKYFESQLGKAFLLSQAMDLSKLAKQLAEETRIGERKHIAMLPMVSSDTELEEAHATRSLTEQVSTGFLTDSFIGSEALEEVETIRQDQEAGFAAEAEGDVSSPEEAENVDVTPIETGAGCTSNGTRPENPTPVHAIGQSSPANVRPLNPTPAHATSLQDRPDAPTPKDSAPNVVSIDTYASIPEQPMEEQEGEEVEPEDYVEKSAIDMEPEIEKSSPFECEQIVKTKVMLENVIGEPRTEPVKLPAYFCSGRPGALPNMQFAQIEAVNRRQTCTTSTIGAIGKTAAPLLNMLRRGFELLPTSVGFGHLREGATYTFSVLLKNVGIDACRFRVRQPPPCTGMRVIYKPGAVAAGMKAELTLEIYAIAVGVEGQTGIGSVAHNLEIVTEVEYLFLPITAKILTVSQWDDEEMVRGRKIKPSAGVQLISYKPPGSQGIIRPRKDSSQQVVEVN